MHKSEPIHIIGGGFSGLVQAFYFVEAGYPVVIHEATGAVGGMISTRRVGSALIESAANAFIASRELERISQFIGVELLPVQSTGRKRFIYRQGQMRRWPLSVRESFPLLKTYWRAKVFKNFPHPEPQETLRSWALQNIGSAGLDYLLEPAMQGVFASSAQNLSAQALFRSLWPTLERGRLRGSVAPRGGMGEWMTKMESYLRSQGCRFEKNASIEDPRQFSRLVLAVSLRDLKSWQNQQKLPELPESLRETRLASLTSVTFLLRKGESSGQGFGCLFPRLERFYSLGVLFNHNLFPGRVENEDSETWILNDESYQFSEMSLTALQRYVLSDRAKLFGRYQEPLEVAVSQWGDRIPIYDRSLTNFHEDLRRSPPPYLLIGNYLGQLGVSRILKLAEENVRRVQGGFFD